MSYVIKAILSNPRRPECGQITIPFPIPADQYDQTIDMLQAMELGGPVNQDCKVDMIDSHYSVLGALKGKLINVDELDYLAKRLDGFCAGEDSQFQAMAHKLEMTDIKDFINLTFCCQQATVITDFSDLEAVGRSHFLTANGGSARMEELENLDGEETALLLIDGGGEVVTPYGVVYDNGMVLEVTPKREVVESDSPEYLYLPASERQIERTLLRVGITELHDAQVRIDWDELPEKVADALDLEHLSGDDLLAFNRMCQAIAPLSEAEYEKLNAVVLMTEAADTAAICQLAENLDQFDFIPGIHTPEEYGRHMIRESGHFEYDENLEGFYDYRRYGEQRIQQEGGQFNECGYVAYQGTMALEELMREDPAEQYQREQGQQMGGL